VGVVGACMGLCLARAGWLAVESLGLVSTLADLEIATFAVDEVVEGTQTGWSDRRLTVSLPQLAVGAGEPALAEATVEVVRPGDPVRISNVLDVVLPDVRVGDRLHRLGGITAVSVCDWIHAGFAEADELPISLVDMAGPGAGRSPWGSTIDVVLRCVPAPGADIAEADAAIRRCLLRLAGDLATATVDAEPTSVETFGSTTGGDESLPAVALILQVASEGPLVDTFWNGEPLGVFEPRIVSVADVLGGSLVSGAYDWPGVRNVTAIYQDNALIKELHRRDGEDLRFAGVVLTPGYLDEAAQKRRAAEAAVSLAGDLHADGVIITTFSSGNSHTDTMLTAQACERRGIGTAAIVCETNGGLTDHVPEATTLVSTGNEDELIDAWTPERVIGGDARASVGERIASVYYVGGHVQTGDTRWTAVPA
jgi:glycine/sarcosine/betaine reductase component B subunit